MHGGSTPGCTPCLSVGTRRHSSKRFVHETIGQGLHSLHAAPSEMDFPVRIVFHLLVLSLQLFCIIDIILIHINAVSGQLTDPYKEFMIAESDSFRSILSKDSHAQYWEDHFSVKERHVPAIFTPFVVKALTSGKYLTVVRSCGNQSFDGSEGKF